MLNSLNFKIFFEVKSIFFFNIEFFSKNKNVFVLNLIVYYVFCKKNFIV